MTMIRHLALLVMSTCLVFGPLDHASAQDAATAPGDSALPAIDANSLASLAGALRGALVQFLPNPLYEASPGWGHTRDIASGLHWSGQGAHMRAEVTRSPRNDGLWRKIRLTAINIPNTLVFDVRNVRQTPSLRLGFTVIAAMDVRAEIEQQRWQAGVRLYSTSVAARLRLKLQVDCECEARLDFKDAVLPDAVFQLHVVRADVGYDNLIVEHAARMGGTAARLLGEAVRSGLRRFDPALERSLLDRARAAIVRAGEAREVRVSLSRLLPKSGGSEK
jgi:hypothetical protein